MKKSYVRELKGDAWEKCLDKSFKKNVKNTKIDGFRKGQAPKEVYIKKYGIESLYIDATDKALSTMFSDLLKEKDVITPACMPSVNIKNIDESHLEVEFTIVSMPEVKLGKYKNLNVKKEKVEVTDHEVEHELEHLKDQFAELKLTDKKIENGFIAIIDFEGFKDNVPFKGGKAQNHSLTIGSNSFIPGFEEGLIGLSKGDEKELSLTFPEAYHVEELKGQEVIFKVKVNEVKERIIPEIDAEFFKDLGMEGIDSLDKLKKEIKDNLKVSKERAAEEDYIIKTLETAIKNAKFELPEEIIEDETNKVYEEFTSRLSMQGLDIANYIKVTNTSEEEIKKQMKPEAEKRISYRLVIGAVADKEKIEITKEEIDKEIEAASKKYNITREDLLKNLGSADTIKYDLRMKKALEIITGIKNEK